jgi:hypothetical protein
MNLCQRISPSCFFMPMAMLHPALTPIAGRIDHAQVTWCGGLLQVELCRHYAACCQRAWDAMSRPFGDHLQMACPRSAAVLPPMRNWQTATGDDR